MSNRLQHVADRSNGAVMQVKPPNMFSAADFRINHGNLTSEECAKRMNQYVEWWEMLGRAPTRKDWEELGITSAELQRILTFAVTRQRHLVGTPYFDPAWILETLNQVDEANNRSAIAESRRLQDRRDYLEVVERIEEQYRVEIERLRDETKQFRDFRERYSAGVEFMNGLAHRDAADRIGSLLFANNPSRRLDVLENRVVSSEPWLREVAEILLYHRVCEHRESGSEEGEYRRGKWFVRAWATWRTVRYWPDRRGWPLSRIGRVLCVPFRRVVLAGKVLWSGAEKLDHE